MTPSPKLLSELTVEFGDAIDLFVCCASFEVRCLSVARHLNCDNVGRVVIARNEPFANASGTNFRELSALFGTKASLLSVSSDDPVSTADNFVSALREQDLGAARHIVVDITTFTHEMLLILYQVGDAFFRSTDTVDFVYAPAADYSLGDPPEKKWLSKGIREVRSVMGFPGKLLPSQSAHLIILGGFEEFRALALIRELEPSLVSVGYGDRNEQSTGPHQETNEVKVRRLRSLVGDVHNFVFSCYDPVSACETLTALVATSPGYNTVLAPMNTKLSTLGAARFATLNEQVQVCYAQPEIYNYSAYSKPGTEYYSYRFADFPHGSALDGS
jgi:hypothetical protein